MYFFNPCVIVSILVSCCNGCGVFCLLSFGWKLLQVGPTDSVNWKEGNQCCLVFVSSRQPVFLFFILWTCGHSHRISWGFFAFFACTYTSASVVDNIYLLFIFKIEIQSAEVSILVIVCFVSLLCCLKVLGKVRVIP